MTVQGKSLVDEQLRGVVVADLAGAPLRRNAATAKIRIGDEVLLRATVTRVDERDGTVTVEIRGQITIHHTLPIDSSTIYSVTANKR
jgi:hypothetical protein